MEATIIKSWTRTANLRRWLRRPDCPEAVKQLKVLFNKHFVPVNAHSQIEKPVQLKSSRRAYFKLDGTNFSRASTHEGNASIIYRATPSTAPIAGQIRDIVTGPDNAFCLHVRPYKPLSGSLYDPFVRYPYLQGTTYASRLQEVEHIIELDDIVAHAARFDYSHGRSVLVNLSRQ